MGTRPAAQRYRLAHVQRASALVTEHVDARVVGRRGQIGPLIRRGIRSAGSVLRARRRDRAGPRRRPPWRRWRTGEEERAEQARARERVRQGPVDLGNLDPQRVGQRSQPAPTHEQGEAPRKGYRARRGRRGPLEALPFERLPQHSQVEARVVSNQHPALEQVGDLGQHLLRRGRAVHHPLGDAGEALDAARQRPFRPDQGVECLVQLASTHEHGAHLGHLAEVAAEPVGLGVRTNSAGAVVARVVTRTADATPRVGRIEGERIVSAAAGRSRPPVALASKPWPLRHSLRLLHVRPREPQVARALPGLRGSGTHAGRGDTLRAGGPGRRWRRRAQPARALEPVRARRCPRPAGGAHDHRHRGAQPCPGGGSCRARSY